jgi:hypothetical protein
MLPARFYALLCLVLVTLCAGCTVEPIAFEPLDYRNDTLSVTVTTSVPITHADVQVMVSALEGIGQREVFTEARYVDLVKGENRLTYTVALAPGQYRCYLHVFEGTERRAAVIQELTVPERRSS